MAGRFLKYDTTVLYFHFHATQVWIFNKCCWGIKSQAIVRGICFIAKYSSWKKLQFVHDFQRNICYIIFDVFFPYGQLCVCVYCEWIVTNCLFLHMTMWHICFLAYMCLNLVAIITIRYIGSAIFTPLPQRYERYLKTISLFQIHSIWAQMKSDLGVLGGVSELSFYHVVSISFLWAKLSRWW